MQGHLVELTGMILEQKGVTSVQMYFRTNGDTGGTGIRLLVEGFEVVWCSSLPP